MGFRCEASQATRVETLGKKDGWLVGVIGPKVTQSIGGDAQIIFTPEMKDSSNGNEVLSLEFGHDEL